MSVIGVIGRRIRGGEKTVEFNRELYPAETETQCLNAREFRLLKQHYEGIAKLQDKDLKIYQPHIEGCCDCRERIAKEIGFTHAAVAIGLQEDSLHTSASPDEACRPFCKTHRVAKVKDIGDWSQIRVQ